MGSQDEQANLATSIINSSLQNVSNYCAITCSSSIDNTNVTIIGGNATIDITNTCSIVGSECMIKNIISSQITNLIKNMVEQEQDNLGIFSLLGPSSSATTNISNSIKNQVSQLITNNCAIGSTDSVVNTNVFAQDANLKLTIGNTNSISKADCSLDTVAKLVLNNSVSNSVTQKQSSCGSILGILIAVIIIAIIIILFPILFSISGVAGRGIKAAGRIIPADKKK